jgi:type II restriction/modification system DNA methylase subunit YeeA
MTPESFIAKWRANTRNERAACHEHFIDLCHLLDEPTPNSDPDGANYAFEKGATKATGGDGWADVWRRECFAWEYKGKHHDLAAAHRQLLNYAGALGNPPLLVVSDIERITVRTNWTNAVSERHEFLLEDLADARQRALLKAVFSDPERLRPGKTRAALTAQAASEFAELATRLRGRGHAPQTVAHFVNRLVFCMFADDVGLLPAKLFTEFLASSRRKPTRFRDYARSLFAAMAERDGAVGFTQVPWFNGGLFDDDTALPLEADDIALLQRAAELDWAEIDPSIMGTLFERGLDPDKRSQLGAHYTARDMIERLIDPVVRRPLHAEWQETLVRMKDALSAKPARARGGKNGTGPREADRLFHAFLDRLRAFRVLDPACGSGNFLYLSLLALKDLEHQAMIEAEALGLQREFPQVGPEAVLGIEINPFAAELARVSVWIGHIQWARRQGFPPPSDPVLRKLDTIECRDAILDASGIAVEWPACNAIVGNPPFLGGKRLRTILGDSYCERLFAAYAGQVPAEADLVCYWFARAQEAVSAGRVTHVGLVATNSIRGGANRRVLEPLAQADSIRAAWADEPWTLEGAAVRVSLICWGPSTASGPFLDGAPVTTIHADLTAGASDITTAKPLAENAGVAFMGDTKGGAFDIPGKLARQWLVQPTNANGQPNAKVLRPWANGMDVTRRSSDNWIIDFGWTMTATDAAFYAAPFAHISEHVRPVRINNKRAAYAREWWRHVEARPGLHAAVMQLRRFIVTPRVAKHRIFAWLKPPTLPDTRLFAFARDDDFFFGFLHSRFHEIWSIATASWHGVGNDPTYNATICFETFPFPEGLTPNLPAASYAADPRAEKIAAAAQNLVAARDRWLNPPELVDIVPEVVAGFPDRILPKNDKAAAILKTRTLTNLYNTRGTPAGAWLDNLHRTLDEAVAAAYGWPADLPESEILARLLALNHARAPRQS